MAFVRSHEDKPEYDESGNRLDTPRTTAGVGSMQETQLSEQQRQSGTGGADVKNMGKFIEAHQDSKIGKDIGTNLGGKTTKLQSQIGAGQQEIAKEYDDAKTKFGGLSDKLGLEKDDSPLYDQDRRELDRDPFDYTIGPVLPPTGYELFGFGSRRDNEKYSLDDFSTYYGSHGTNPDSDVNALYSEYSDIYDNMPTDFNSENVDKLAEINERRQNFIDEYFTKKPEIKSDLETLKSIDKNLFQSVMGISGDQAYTTPQVDELGQLGTDVALQQEYLESLRNAEGRERALRDTYGKRAGYTGQMSAMDRLLLESKPEEQQRIEDLAGMGAPMGEQYVALGEEQLEKQQQLEDEQARLRETLTPYFAGKDAETGEYGEQSLFGEFEREMQAAVDRRNVGQSSAIEELIADIGDNGIVDNEELAARFDAATINNIKNQLKDIWSGGEITEDDLPDYLGKGRETVKDLERTGGAYVGDGGWKSLAGPIDYNIADIIAAGNYNLSPASELGYDVGAYGKVANEEQLARLRALEDLTGVTDYSGGLLPTGIGADDKYSLSSDALSGLKTALDTEKEKAAQQIEGIAQSHAFELADDAYNAVGSARGEGLHGWDTRNRIANYITTGNEAALDAPIQVGPGNKPRAGGIFQSYKDPKEYGAETWRGLLERTGNQKILNSIEKAREEYVALKDRLNLGE